jgi:HAD superfamily hydrolase (TIGR01549 family)
MIIMAKPKLVILGVDGVLRDSSAAFNEGLARGFMKVGLFQPYLKNDLWRLRGIGKYNLRENAVAAIYALSIQGKDLSEALSLADSEGYLDSLTENSLNDADRRRVARITETSREFCNSSLARYMSKLLPNARNSIKCLKDSGHELAIFSNASGPAIMRDLKEIGLENFSIILSGSEVSMPKPSPEGLKRIISEIGVSAEEAIYAGDAQVDIIAARNAGCISAALLSGMGLKSHLESCGPSHIFENISELSRNLREMQTG